MNRVNQLLEVVGASLKNEKYDEKNIDYDVLYADALSHSVHTIAYNAVRKQNDVWSDKKNAILAFSLDYVRKIENALALFDEMQNMGISAVAVKGLFVHGLYPSADLRLMSDADIILKNREDIEKVTDFFEEKGYTAKNTADNVVNFSKENELSFEVHLFVKLQRYTKKGDASETTRETINLDNTRTEQIGNKKIEVLHPTWHYIYIIGHMGTHFSAGGIGLRQLVDAWLFAKKYKEEIDWKIFWDTMENLGYTGFACNVLYICEKKFSFDTDGIFVPKWSDCSEELLYDIYSGGVFGQKSKEQKYGRMLSAGGGNILKTVFPLYIEDEKYSYAMKHRALLPVAWGHRLIDFVFGKFSAKDIKYISKNNDISKRRLNLFDKLGM